MEFGTKLWLRDASDYQRVITALRDSFRSRTCYTDYFFDFSNHALTLKNAILRLRVPYVDPHSPTTVDADVTNEQCTAEKPTTEAGLYGATPSVKGFIESFNTSCNGTQDFVHVSQAVLDASAAGIASDVELVYKSGNTVGDGDQMSFSVRARGLAPAITRRLLTCRGGNGEGNSKDGDDVLSILTSYADELAEADRQASDDAAAATTSGALVDTLREIVRRLQQVACEDGPTRSRSRRARQASTSRSQPLTSSQTQRRATSVRSNTTLPSQHLRNKDSDDENNEASSGEDMAWRMQRVGSYCTTRKVFAFRRGAAAAAAVASGSSDTGNSKQGMSQAPETADTHSSSSSSKAEGGKDAEVLVRVDRSLFANEERYELETLPTTDPTATDVKDELEAFLTRLQVKFTPASESKYVRYIIGNAGRRAPLQRVQDVKLRLTSVAGYKEVRNNLQSALPFTGHPQRHSRSRSYNHTNNKCGNNSSSGGDGAAMMMMMGNSNDGVLLTTTTTKRQRSRSFSHRRPPHCLHAFASDTSSTSNDENDDDGGPNAKPFTEEFHENFFFDGPNGELARQRGFLRLRRFNHGDTYELVLKEGQRFEDGRQENQTCKTQLLKDVASLLLSPSDPSAFLRLQQGQNTVASILWNSYGLRELHATVQFCTCRLTAMWWSAQGQRPTELQHMSATQQQAQQQEYPTAPAMAALIPMTLDYLNSQQPGRADCVPPLVLHLDRTTYTLPPASPPASQTEPSQRRKAVTPSLCCHDLYELEVTNLCTASPAQVMYELGAVLQEMGVEWTPGTESKLDYYYSLLHRRQATPVNSCLSSQQPQ